MGRISQEDFEFRITQSDSLRRSIHDVAIDACKQLNRLCDAYSVERFCPEESADRHQVADFIGTFVYNIYEDGQGNRSMDKSIEDARKKGLNADRGYEKVSRKRGEECR